MDIDDIGTSLVPSWSRSLGGTKRRAVDTDGEEGQTSHASSPSVLMLGQSRMENSRRQPSDSSHRRLRGGDKRRASHTLSGQPNRSVPRKRLDNEVPQASTVQMGLESSAMLVSTDGEYRRKRVRLSASVQPNPDGASMMQRASQASDKEAMLMHYDQEHDNGNFDNDVTKDDEDPFHTNYYIKAMAETEDTEGWVEYPDVWESDDDEVEDGASVTDEPDEEFEDDSDWDDDDQDQGDSDDTITVINISDEIEAINNRMAKLLAITDVDKQSRALDKAEVWLEGKKKKLARAYKLPDNAMGLA